MAKITIEVNNCKQCPFLNEVRMHTADSWERAFDWFCTKENNRKISGYVEWHEEDKVKIPNWCPIQVKPQNDEGSNTWPDPINHGCVLSPL